MILDRNGHRWIRWGFMSALLVAVIGCQGARGRRITKTEPALSSSINDDVIIGESPSAAASPGPAPARTAGYVDRHPILSKPREYWDSSGENKVVKAAAATFIGVPAGVLGEMRQIVVGTPSEPKY